MVTHMKTTVELAQPLLEEAKATARAEGRTLRSLLEEGLRLALARRKSPGPDYALPDRSVEGEGLRPELAEGGWAAIRGAIYEGHGG